MYDSAKSMLFGILLSILQIGAPEAVRQELATILKKLSDVKDQLDANLEQVRPRISPRPDYFDVDFTNLNALQAVLDDPVYVCSIEHQTAVTELIKSAEEGPALIKLILSFMRYPHTSGMKKFLCGEKADKNYVQLLVAEGIAREEKGATTTTTATTNANATTTANANGQSMQPGAISSAPPLRVEKVIPASAEPLAAASSSNLQASQSSISQNMSALEQPKGNPVESAAQEVQRSSESQNRLAPEQPQQGNPVESVAREVQQRSESQNRLAPEQPRGNSMASAAPSSQSSKSNPASNPFVFTPTQPQQQSPQSSEFSTNSAVRLIRGAPLQRSAPLPRSLPYTQPNRQDRAEAPRGYQNNSEYIRKRQQSRQSPQQQRRSGGTRTTKRVLRSSKPLPLGPPPSYG
jgi:hypothetical protein